jgi:hypothetical protein
LAILLLLLYLIFFVIIGKHRKNKYCWFKYYWIY